MSERDAIIETMARGIEPTLFGGDAHQAHRAARPYNIKFARAAVLQRVRLALTALESAGYVIAKREPDDAMIEAGSTARCYREDGERDGLTDDNTTATWRAMIAAQEQK